MFASKLLVIVSATLFAVASADVSLNSHHRRVAHRRVPRHQRRTQCKPRSQRQSTVSATQTQAAEPEAFSIIPSAVVSSDGFEPSLAAVQSSVFEEQSSSSKSKAASSTKASSPKPSASSAPSQDKPPANTGALRQLFPVSSKKSWSTHADHEGARVLSDATLVPTKEIKALAHPYVSAPDGKKAMKGSYTFTHQPQGGVSFYAQGPADFDLSNAREATFGYSVMFEEGFDFNKGGKLFGLYGGDSEDEAVSCSGGRRSDACFSARLMWRTEGAGEFYTYFPQNEANEKLCTVKPESDCNPTYGNSVGRGSFQFAKGEWTTVSQRVRLNDVGESNGEIELFVNGKSVINVPGLVLRVRDAGRFRGMQMQSFFGGSKPEWASPKDQNTYFSDFSVAVTESF